MGKRLGGFDSHPRPPCNRGSSSLPSSSLRPFPSSPSFLSSPFPPQASRLSILDSFQPRSNTFEPLFCIGVQFMEEI